MSFVKYQKYKCTICMEDNHDTKQCIKRCKVCNGAHVTSLHKCSICNTIGAEHGTFYCPLRCPCNGYHTLFEHRCLYCGVRNPDHKDEDCNVRFNVRRI